MDAERGGPGGARAGVDGAFPGEPAAQPTPFARVDAGLLAPPGPPGAALRPGGPLPGGAGRCRAAAPGAGERLPRPAVHRRRLVLLQRLSLLARAPGSGIRAAGDAG